MTPVHESNGTAGPDEYAAIESSKIFSLPNHKGALLPVLETVSPSGSVFSINLVSCVTGHFYGEKNNTLSHEARAHAMFTPLKTL